ncbi:uncharacterized protein LOC114262094 [Camellia sinensis]|uniref:uncharacterized protein LOC114262094 n=1 Tax=Camellia sinensis TaxID=4442 RepID=UPI001035C540|nr:uncharacterized protein LOC114262094 [Camellia sinensis]
MTIALRILQYGVPIDDVDEYIRIDETTAIVALNFFTRTIVAIYEGVYLKSPNESDVARLLSPLFSKLTRGRDPVANYTINNHAYTMGYYLVDGIYPHCTTIMKTISQPQGLKRQLFARIQEAFRRDIKRAFGVLRARFNIFRVPARGWNDENLYYIMKTCIILHNTIIENERNIPENKSSATLLETDITNTLCQVLRNL